MQSYEAPYLLDLTHSHSFELKPASRRLFFLRQWALIGNDKKVLTCPVVQQYAKNSCPLDQLFANG
jgi:hypothetical protein